MPGEEQDDEIRQVGGSQQLAPNAKCPISGIQLMSLKEPVQCVAPTLH